MISLVAVESVNFPVINPGIAIPDVQLIFEATQNTLFRLGNDIHRTIGKISYVSANAKLQGCMPDKPAETNSLHPAMGYHLPLQHVMFTFRFHP